MPPPPPRSRTSNGSSKPSAPISRAASSGNKPSSSRANVPSVAPRPNPLPSSSTTPNCECDHPAQRKKVTQHSAREGKEFYACGNGDRCGFFKWCEDGPPCPPAITVSVVPSKRALTSERSVSLSSYTTSCYIQSLVRLTRSTPLHVDVNDLRTRHGVLSLRRGQIKGEFSGDVPKGRKAVNSLGGTMNLANLQALLLHDPCRLDQ